MPESQMLINYVSGEECRIAIVTNGRLEELVPREVSFVCNVNVCGENIKVGPLSISISIAALVAFVYLD